MEKISKDQINKDNINIDPINNDNDSDIMDATNEILPLPALWEPSDKTKAKILSGLEHIANRPKNRFHELNVLIERLYMSHLTAATEQKAGPISTSGMLIKTKKDIAPVPPILAPEDRECIYQAVHYPDKYIRDQAVVITTCSLIQFIESHVRIYAANPSLPKKPSAMDLQDLVANMTAEIDKEINDYNPGYALTTYFIRTMRKISVSAVCDIMDTDSSTHFRSVGKHVNKAYMYLASIGIENPDNTELSIAISIITDYKTEISPKTIRNYKKQHYQIDSLDAAQSNGVQINPVSNHAFTNPETAMLLLESEEQVNKFRDNLVPIQQEILDEYINQYEIMETDRNRRQLTTVMPRVSQKKVVDILAKRHPQYPETYIRAQVQNFESKVSNVFYRHHSGKRRPQTMTIDDVPMAVTDYNKIFA